MSKKKSKKSASATPDNWSSNERDSEAWTKRVGKSKKEMNRLLLAKARELKDDL